MFVQAVLLKHKACYCKQQDRGKEEDKFTIEIVIKSNHQIGEQVLKNVEADIKRISIPMGYRLDEEKKKKKEQED